MKEQILIIPGSFSLVSAYNDYNGINIWLKNETNLDTATSEWLVANSAGANYILSKGILPNQKLILVNPLVKKRSYFSLLVRDIHFFINEGIEKNKLIPFSSWISASIKVLKLLRVNVLDELRKLSKDRVFIIKGRQDNYFCDNENAELIRKEGFTLFEVEAKHNWNKNIKSKVEEIIEQVRAQKQ